MDHLKGGLVCAAIGCNNKSYKCKKSFFRFPVDPIRAEKWVIASNREDLLPKIYDLSKSYRLCGDHFESVMFTNKFCNRLNQNAVPTIFPSLKAMLKRCYFTVDHTYSRPALVHLDMPSLGSSRDFSLRNLTVTQDVTRAEIPELQHDMNTDSELADIPPDLLSAHRSLQTSNTSSSNTPRKGKYIESLKSLKIENKRLKMKIQDLEYKLENV